MKSENNSIAELDGDKRLSLLRDPCAYPHHPAAVNVVQTHISFVAVAPPYVYKIKKPVDFGFVDYSTLDKRRYYCDEEVRLNRRLCEDAYIGVVPVSRARDGLVFENDDDVVDYAVKMKCLRDGCFLDQLLARDQAGFEILERVAERLDAFYRDRRSSPEIATWGRIEKLRISMQENFEQIAPFVDSLLAPAALKFVREYTETFFLTHATLFNQRRANGRIIDGHGDLRLEHIHVTPDSLSVIDCIEFSDRLRWIDIINDVAFLAMDLDFINRPDLSAAFVRHFWRNDIGEDIAGLLNFYKCYRACVRGKVQALKSREPEVNSDEREQSRAQAVKYFQLALNYAATGFRPVVAIVMGRIGSGKSTLAKGLSEALGREVFSSDRMRKQLAELETLACEDLYGDAMNQATYDALIRRAVASARGGKSVILDATFGSRRHRDQLRHNLRACSLEYRMIEMVAPESALKQRLAERTVLNASASDARLPDFDMINAKYEPPDDLEDANHRRVDATADTDVALEAVFRHLMP